MKSVLFLLVCAICISYVASRTITCHATGDPHYTSFFGKAFHVYGYQGDVVLAKLPGKDFEIQTRMQYSHPWANRALQTNVAIEIDGNLIVSNGGRNQNIRNTLSVNGKKENLNFKKTYHNGVTVTGRVGNSNHMVYNVISPKLGITIRFNSNKHGNFIYHNIYVDIPTNLRNSFNMQGLCGMSQNTHNRPLSRGQFAYARKRGEDLFKKKFVPQAHAKRLGPVKWTSSTAKRNAEKWCKSKGLSGDLYKDCLYDVKLAKGNVKAAAGYSSAAHDMKALMRMGEANGDGHLHAIYVVVNNIKKEALLEVNKAKKVYNGLAKEYNVLSEDLKRCETMMKASGRFTDKSHRSTLGGLIGAMARGIRTQKASIQKNMGRQKRIIKSGEEEIAFVRKVLGFVGKMIYARRKGNGKK